MTALPIPRIVELVRVSTKKQVDDGTPAMQRSDLMRLRDSRPGTLVKRIEALGVSGAKGVAERVDLQELFALAKEKAFDELRVWNLDRLTRAEDPRERFAIYGAVADANAKIVDCHGKVIDPTQESGELDYYLGTLFAAKERKRIVERYSKGKKEKASQGLLSQGKPPYARRFFHFKAKMENGKTVKTGEWRVVPEELVIYRRVVEEALAGMTPRQICAGLNRDGIPARVGQKWRHSTILRLLKHPAIVGEYRPMKDCLTMIPPVATREEWKRLKERLKANASKSGPKRTLPALLRGKLTCAVCGRRTVVLSDGAGAVHRYGCPKPSHRDERCHDRPTVRAPYADRHFRVALSMLLGSSDDLLEAVKVLNTKPAPDTNKDRETTLKDLAKLEARQARILSLMNDGLVTDSAGRDELRKVRELRELAEEKKARLSTEPTYSFSTTQKPQLLKAARELGEAIADASDARMMELLDILFPPQAPFFLKLSKAGIEGVGLLPLTGDLDTTSLRADRIAGIPFRIVLPLEERRAKLSAGQVKEIRANFARGHVTQTQLAKLYGVNVSMVNRIVHGKRWVR